MNDKNVPVIGLLILAIICLIAYCLTSYRLEQLEALTILNANNIHGLTEIVKAKVDK